jgi:hypothetical protein
MGLWAWLFRPRPREEAKVDADGEKDAQKDATAAAQERRISAANKRTDSALQQIERVEMLARRRR